MVHYGFHCRLAINTWFGITEKLFVSMKQPARLTLETPNNVCLEKEWNKSHNIYAVFYLNSPVKHVSEICRLPVRTPCIWASSHVRWRSEIWMLETLACSGNANTLLQNCLGWVENCCSFVEGLSFTDLKCNRSSGRKPKTGRGE